MPDRVAFASMNIFLTQGLSNKLRTLLGYLWVAAQEKEELNVCWEIGDACNGHFLDIFEPIYGLNFINSENGAEMDFSGFSTFDEILYGYMRRDNVDTDIYEEHQRMYRKLRPLPHIQEKANMFCEKNSISRCIGMHIRRTDHEVLAKAVESYSPDVEFIRFIQNNPDCAGVFIATDNKATQDLFASLYGNRVLFYNNIGESERLRKTSLEEALIDILICSKCRSFQGSRYSSYSNLIEILRSLSVER